MTYSGHTAAQYPQRIHFDWSTATFFSPMLSAFWSHSSMHAPQAIQRVVNYQSPVYRPHPPPDFFGDGRLRKIATFISTSASSFMPARPPASQTGNRPEIVDRFLHLWRQVAPPRRLHRIDEFPALLGFSPPPSIPSRLPSIMLNHAGLRTGNMTSMRGSWFSALTPAMVCVEAADYPDCSLLFSSLPGSRALPAGRAGCPGGNECR